MHPIPSTLLLNCPAHGSFAHSLSAIAAVSFVQVSYGPCLGKSRRVAGSQDGDCTVRLPKLLLLQGCLSPGRRRGGERVTRLTAEPLCCWEDFPCLSPNPFPDSPGKATCWACVCSTDSDFSALFWKCNKSSLAGGPQLLGAVNLYSEHGKRHVLCWHKPPPSLQQHPGDMFPIPTPLALVWVSCPALLPLFGPKAAEQTR